MKNDRYFSVEVPYLGTMGGIVTLPAGYDKTKESLPVILFLHGSGESGDGSPAAAEKVKAHAVPKLFGADADYKGLRAITVSPQCPWGLVWDQVALQTMQYLDAALGEFGGDRSRVAATGLSMGGFGTWSLLTTWPERFCRAAVVCGGAVSWRIGEPLKGKPIRIYHSVDDGAVPYLFAGLTAQCAVKIGAQVELISYTNEGHGCWNRAYEQTDLIPWLIGE